MTYAMVPAQVELGEHRMTFNVHVHANGTNSVAVTLKTPDGRITLRTRHAADDEVAILAAITGIADESRGVVEANHRATMRAKGYKID